MALYFAVSGGSKLGTFLNVSRESFRGASDLIGRLQSYGRQGGGKGLTCCVQSVMGGILLALYDASGNLVISENDKAFTSYHSRGS